jgi:hypothetical protein
VRLRRPMNQKALAALQERLVPIATWDTCHIEGNTVSLSETIVLLEYGIVSGGGHRFMEYAELVATRDAIVHVLRAQPWRTLLEAEGVLSLTRNLHTALKATPEADLGRYSNNA